MVFSSILFLLYFLPAFLVIYYLLPYKLRNPWVLIASIFFYSWGAPDFIFIVLGSIIADFYLVKYIHKADKPAKIWLAGISVIMNVGLLAYFKYANFFINNVNHVLGHFGVSQVHWLAIALPIGISFFTFQKITYAVDVYRNVHAPLKRIGDYAMYILMFPHLIAGPIVRFNLVADQIEDRRYNETVENRMNGFYRFVIGLSKKVLIANVLGAEVDKIFTLDALSLGTGQAWTGIIAYAFQIYFDFSGYSDMAIGLALMIGFNFPENFNNPYISQSITEFWRRWHMTLGRFMREYLYIPLGGNRVSTTRLYLNLWIVFFLSGLWHGAAWNFVAWGAFHGFFLVADRLFLLKILEKIGKAPAMIFTFFVSLIGWVLFRSENLSYAMDYLKTMFSFSGNGQPVELERKFVIILFLAVIFSFMAAIKGVEAWQMRMLGSGDAGRQGGIEAWKPGTGNWELGTVVTRWGFKVGFILIFFLFSLAAIISSGFNPFIYFRF
jgi:alginate O-acetyltransferase complex protein AlgI